jgi:6-phosphofructo-2-kinase/fructose-2,6-biphosphatase 2
MVKWFDEEEGEVALYDATNTTKERRIRVLDCCRANDIEVT